MNKYLKAIGIALAIAATYIVIVWIGNRMTHSNKTTPQADSTAVECCDTTQVCDSTSVYAHETDSCCKH